MKASHGTAIEFVNLEELVTVMKGCVIQVNGCQNLE